MQTYTTSTWITTWNRCDAVRGPREVEMRPVSRVAELAMCTDGLIDVQHGVRCGATHSSVWVVKYMTGADQAQFANATATAVNSRRRPCPSASPYPRRRTVEDLPRRTLCGWPGGGRPPRGRLSGCRSALPVSRCLVSRPGRIRGYSAESWALDSLVDRCRAAL